MKTTKTKIEFAGLPKDYAALCRMCGLADDRPSGDWLADGTRFVDWLVAEAKTVTIASSEAVLSSPPPAARSNGAKPRARSAR